MQFTPSGFIDCLKKMLSSADVSNWRDSAERMEKSWEHLTEKFGDFKRSLAETRSAIEDYFTLQEEITTDQSFRLNGNFVIKTKELDLCRVAVLFHYRPTNVYYQVWRKLPDGEYIPLALAGTKPETDEYKAGMRILITKSEGVQILDRSELPYARSNFNVKLIEASRVNHRRLWSWIALCVSILAFLCEIFSILQTLFRG